MGELLVFDNVPMPGWSYRDHLDTKFRAFVGSVGGGSHVVRCHPAAMYLFDYIGIKPTMDESMPRDEASIAGRRIRITNL